MKKNLRKCIILRWVACTEDLIVDRKIQKKTHKEKPFIKRFRSRLLKFRRIRSYRKIKAEAAEIMNVIREIFQPKMTSPKKCRVEKYI